MFPMVPLPPKRAKKLNAEAPKTTTNTTQKSQSNVKMGAASPKRGKGEKGGKRLFHPPRPWNSRGTTFIMGEMAQKSQKVRFPTGQKKVFSETYFIVYSTL